MRGELGGRIDRLERRIDVLEARVGEVARGLPEFREAFYSYQNAD